MRKNTNGNIWKRNKWRIVSGAVAVAFAASGAGMTIAAYRNKDFQPDKSVKERQKRDNQIVFPGQDIAADENGTDDSKMWEQDSSSENKHKESDRTSAPMLFQTKKITDAQSTDDKTDQKSDESSDRETVYSAKKDKSGTGGEDNRTIVDNKGGTGGGDGAGNGKRPGSGDDSVPGKSDGDDNSGGGDKPGNNKPGSNDKPGSGNKPGSDDKPGNNDKPGINDKPDNDDKPGDDDKPGTDDPEDPQPGITDNDPTMPSLPKDDTVIPADPYPGDDNVNIKDDDEYKRYSLMVIGLQNDDDRINSLYTGEYLNDQRVLCSVIVYVCVDGTPKYRLTELGDNFKLGDYPKQVTTDTVDLTFKYRPGSKYDWIEATYSYPVQYSGKLVLKGSGNDQYVMQYLMPKDDHRVNMFRYFDTMKEETLAGNKLFLGWSESDGGHSTGIFYTYDGTGAQIMYPVFNELSSDQVIQDGSSMEWQGYQMNIDNIFYYSPLQTLKSYSTDTDVLNIPNGIQAVDLPTDIDWDTWELKVQTYRRIRVPESMMILGGQYGDVAQAVSYSFKVTDSYEVDEDNLFYSSYDGLLLDKDQKVIYAIPDNKTVVNIPATVEKVNFSYDNVITEVHVNSQKPADIDFSELTGARIYVPATSYVKYVAAWGKNPGGYVKGNELLPDSGQDIQLVEDEQAIYSSDGETLISVKSSVDGVYVVKNGVKKIAAGALENCGQLDIMILPDSVNELESESLSDNPPGKIVFLGRTAPKIDKDTFDSTTVLQVELAAEAEYESEWEPVIGDKNDIMYREFRYVSENGYEYLDEAAYESETAGAVLIKAAGDISVFNENSVPGVQWKMIGPKAFAGCSNLYMAEFPETLKSIGRAAFAECGALQGIVSYSKDCIEISDGAFDGAGNLRFMAYNAADVELYDNYWGPAVVYAPVNSAGYSNADRFSPYYFLENVNADPENGILLYGAASDENGAETEGSYLLGATTDVSGSISLRDDTLEIAGYVFRNCANEFTVEGLDRISAFGNGAFQDSGLCGEINITDSCVYIGGYAFSGCAGITKVTIDGSGLDKSVYMWPLGNGAFSRCSGVESVIIKGTGYYDLCESEFAGCTSLTSIDIAPEAGIAAISYTVFSMTAIAEISLPKSVRSIGFGAFDSCNYLKKVNFASEKAPELVIFGPGIPFSFGSGLPESGWLSVPEGCEQNYIDKWKYYMYGWSPEIHDSMTDEEIQAGANMIRSYLGLPSVFEQDTQPGGIVTTDQEERPEDSVSEVQADTKKPETSEIETDTKKTDTSETETDTKKTETSGTETDIDKSETSETETDLEQLDTSESETDTEWPADQETGADSEQPERSENAVSLESSDKTQDTSEKENK